MEINSISFCSSLNCFYIFAFERYLIGFSVLFFIKYFVVVPLPLTQFFPLCSPLPSPTLAPTVKLHPTVHVHGPCTPVPWLVPSLTSHALKLSWFLSGLCQSVPCFHVCGSILLVCLFCSLGSSYRWDHMVLVFHHLAYFTEYDILQFLPCCLKG